MSRPLFFLFFGVVLATQEVGVAAESSRYAGRLSLPEGSAYSLDATLGRSGGRGHRKQRRVLFTVDAADRSPGWLPVPHSAGEDDQIAIRP